MSVRLQLPRGGAFTFTRQFVAGGTPVDITSATLVAYLKRSPDDDDADAVAALAISPLVAASGTVLIVISAAATADLERGVEHFWQARATVGGTTYAPEALQGPVVLTPLDGVLAGLLRTDGITETLTPADSPTVAAATGSGVISRADLTGLTGGAPLNLDGIVTASSTLYPVGTIVILSYGLVSQIWKLVAGTDAEDTSATPAVVRPDDFNASTNAAVWKQIG